MGILKFPNFKNGKILTIQSSNFGPVDIFRTVEAVHVTGKGRSPARNLRAKKIN
jgi:hypothetical protein